MKTRRGSFSIRLFSLLRRAEVGGRVHAFTATASRNERNLRETTNADCSELSFLRLSLALLIIGVFWMVVQLHAYVVWLRGGEKALLLVSVIASCIAIHGNDGLRRNSQEKKSSIWLSIRH